ncbi:MAG: hypothetical protein ACXVLF_12290 [Flavisolibacter sp.]
MADKTRYEPTGDPSIPKSEDTSGEISPTNDTENIQLNRVTVFMETW